MESGRLGPYLIREELGVGGMGKVWRAEVVEEAAGLEPGEVVAIKAIHPHLLETPGYFQRFLREGEIGRDLHHPNVVRCFSCDAVRSGDQKLHILVMEYVEGQTLRALLDELAIVPEELCRHIGREIAKGLTAIHAIGAVHRDLKPANVLITEDHTVKIMDLGVARVTDDALRLSMTGSFVGSMEYAAPEQFSGGTTVDARADLYGAGALLYELATGRPPFREAELRKLIRQVLSDEPVRSGKLNPQLSAFFEEVVHTLLRKDREERLTDARELLLVLAEGEESPWWRERSRKLQEKTRRPLRRIRIQRETMVYGREGELSRLRDLFHDAARGEGRVALIEGEAGIGKSRLVDEMVTRLEADGADVNFLFASFPPGGAATAAGAWADAFRRQIGSEDTEEVLGRYLADIPILIPAFAALLRGEPPPRGEEQLTKDSLHTVFIHAARTLAAERPTIVLIEDLHFAPEEGRALFASLALASPGHRILLLGTSRRGLPDNWTTELDRLEHAQRMRLERLGPKDLAKLLVDAFHSERLAEELAYRIGVKSDGNPFFVFEIIRGLREGQLIRKGADGTWATTRAIREIEVPSSVVELVQARISDLTEEETEILDVASCCGYDFDPGIVADVVGEGLIPVLRRLGGLEKSHHLVCSVGRRFEFDHHQVQEALYGALSEPLREEYHALIADSIEGRTTGKPRGKVAVDLTDHYLRGARGEAALPHLGSALDHLEEGYQGEAVVDLAERALATPDLLTGNDRAELLLRMARILGIRGRSEEEGRAVDEALELAEDRSLLARARVAKGKHLLAVSKYDEARKQFGEEAGRVAERGDRTEEEISRSNLGKALSSLSRYREAQVVLERAIERSRELGNRETEREALTELATVFEQLDRYDDALANYEAAREIAEESEDRYALAATVGREALTLWHMGRNEEARQMLERSVSLNREIGARRAECHDASVLSLVLTALGNPAEAAEWEQRYLTLGLETGNKRAQAVGFANLGLSSLEEGRVERALRNIGRSVDVSREIGDRRREAVALAYRGRILALLGDLESAVGEIEESIRIARDLGTRSVEAMALRCLAHAEHMHGDSESAGRSAELARDILAEVGFAGGLASALLDIGKIRWADGDDPGARAVFDEALAIAEENGFPQVAAAVELEVAMMEGDADTIRRFLEEYGEHLSVTERMGMHHAVWKATGERESLLMAHRQLEVLHLHSPEDHRESVFEEVPLHREIHSAWESAAR